MCIQCDCDTEKEDTVREDNTCQYNTFIVGLYVTVGNIYSIANWIPLALLHLVTEHQPHQCGLQAGVSISKAEGNGSFLFPLVHTLCTLRVDWMCWTVKDFQFVYSGNDQHGAATQPGALIKPIPAQKMVIMVWLI